MPAETVPLSRFAPLTLHEPDVRILLIDHDPISRHVLGGVLEHADRLCLVASVDSRQSPSLWQRYEFDVVLLCVGPDEDLRPTIGPLVGRGSQVLLLGTQWNRSRLDAAFALGASGCLVKVPHLTNLASAARAVSGGHCVLSPELLQLYVVPAANMHDERRSAGEARAVAQPPLAMLTSREREVLRMLADGCSTKEAACLLHVSPSTIKSHISHALTKLGARNRLEAVLLLRDDVRPPAYKADPSLQVPMVPPAGFEPATSRLEGGSSIR